MTLDDFNMIAWSDFLIWAWNEPEMRAQFTAATSIDIETVKSPINAAIDAATGANNSLAARFIEWATTEQWGLEHAPAAYREKIANADNAERKPRP